MKYSLLVICILILIIIVCGCTARNQNVGVNSTVGVDVNSTANPPSPTPSIPYKTPANLTVTPTLQSAIGANKIIPNGVIVIDSNVTNGINEVWNKTYGYTGVTVNNSSIKFDGFSFNKFEYFTFNTTDGKSYFSDFSIKSSSTPNMLDIDGNPVEYYNLTITPNT